MSIYNVKTIFKNMKEGDSITLRYKHTSGWFCIITYTYVHLGLYEVEFFLKEANGTTKDYCQKEYTSWRHILKRMVNDVEICRFKVTQLVTDEDKRTLSRIADFPLKLHIVKTDSRFHVCHEEDILFEVDEATAHKIKHCMPIQKILTPKDLA